LISSAFKNFGSSAGFAHARADAKRPQRLELETARRSYDRTK
jgi:hypothetical protein